MSAIPTVFEIAGRVSTPLALAGVMLAVLFFIFRQLLAKDIFPRLTRTHGGALLKQLVDRLFILALVAIVLGFAGHFVPRPDPQHAVAPEPTLAEVEATLQKLYAGEIASLYDEFPAATKAQVPYGIFAASTRETMSQFRKPPRDRHLQHKQVVAGQLIFTFDAQFDEISRYRESLTYLNADDRWTLWRFEIVPAGWPPGGMMKPLTAGSAGDLRDRLNRIANLTERDGFLHSDILDHWIPLPGWTTRVESVVTRKGLRTCDARLREETSGALILVENMLDGCALSQGQRVNVIGRVDSVTNDEVQISEPRYSRSESAMR
jgi:hypothetical protein